MLLPNCELRVVVNLAVAGEPTIGKALWLKAALGLETCAAIFGQMSCGRDRPIPGDGRIWSRSTCVPRVLGIPRSLDMAATIRSGPVIRRGERSLAVLEPARIDVIPAGVPVRGIRSEPPAPAQGGLS